jgi:hypothetical protein
MATCSTVSDGGLVPRSLHGLWLTVVFPGRTNNKTTVDTTPLEREPRVPVLDERQQPPAEARGQYDTLLEGRNESDTAGCTCFETSATTGSPNSGQTDSR